MYVVYDETTPDGVKERRLCAVRTQDRLPRRKRGSVQRYLCAGRQRRLVTHVMDWTFLEDEPGDRLPEALAPTEDAFCLADGRLLIFRP